MCAHKIGQTTVTHTVHKAGRRCAILYRQIGAQPWFHKPTVFCAISHTYIMSSEMATDPFCHICQPLTMSEHDASHTRKKASLSHHRLKQ